MCGRLIISRFSGLLCCLSKHMRFIVNFVKYSFFLQLACSFQCRLYWSRYQIYHTIFFSIACNAMPWSVFVYCLLYWKQLEHSRTSVAICSVSVLQSSGLSQYQSQGKPEIPLLALHCGFYVVFFRLTVFGEFFSSDSSSPV